MPSLFDPTIYPDYGATEQEIWNALVHENAAGILQVRGRRTVPQWRLTLDYNQPYGTDLDSLQEFIRGLKGPYTTCWVYTASPWRYWVDAPIEDEYLTLSGESDPRVFYIPGRDIEAASVTVNAVAVTEGTDYEIGIENRCKYSEDLSQTGTWQVYDSSTVTRTGSQTDPEAGSTAWRLQTSGGGNVLKCFQTIATTPAAGIAQYDVIWVKNNSATTVRVKNTSTTDSATNVRAVTQAEGWVEVTLTHTATGSADHQIRFEAPTAGDSLDFFVWHPLACQTASYFQAPGTTWGYIPTKAAAITADTTYGNWYCAFYASPTAGHQILISWRGRRLLLGRLTEDVTYSTPTHGIVSMQLVFVGEEA